MKYSKDGRVSFDPATHIYMLGEKTLTSVTTYINQFKTPFDSDKIATSYALKHGLDKVELLAKWKREGQVSCENGTAIHQVFENYFITKEILLPGAYPKEEVAAKFIEDFFRTKRLMPVDWEVIVYDDELAGQVDCVVKNQNGEYFIIDWKTNKEISTNGYNKFMSDPYQSLPDCNHSHYTLQLNIYKTLYKEHHISGLFICHLGETKYTLIKAENLNLCKQNS